MLRESLLSLLVTFGYGDFSLKEFFSKQGSDKRAKSKTFRVGALDMGFRISGGG